MYAGAVAGGIRKKEVEEAAERREGEGTDECGHIKIMIKNQGYTKRKK